jgi:hypothetical protein
MLNISVVRLTTQTGLPRQETVNICPGDNKLKSASTGAPAALAFSLGCQELTKGTATKVAPAAPKTPVAAVNTLRRVRFLFSVCSFDDIETSSFVHFLNRYTLIVFLNFLAAKPMASPNKP